MQDSCLTSIPWTGKLLAYLFLESLVFRIAEQGIRDPCATWTRHVGQEAQVPLLPCFLDVNEHGRHLHRTHAVHIIVACKELVVHHKWVCIPAWRGEVAELVVQGAVLVELDLG